MTRIVFMLILLFFFVSGKASAITIDTIEINDNEISGVFDVILYGSRHGDDLETAVILAPINGEFQIQIFSPDFDYRIERAKDSKTALDIARRFTSWHPSFMRHRYLKIYTSDGKTVGYEIRPLYLPFEYGSSNVFDNSYRLKGKTVVISIKLIPYVERRLYHFDFDKSSQ